MTRQSGHGDLRPGLDNPAPDGFSITKDDDDPLPLDCRALYIGGDGDVQLDTVGGTTLVFKGLVAGMILPVRTRKVWSTNTSATNLIGLL